MYANLSHYQLKIDLTTEVVLYKPHGTHKAETNNRHTKDKES